MERHTMREGDTLNALSARYRVPACAILRANRVFSPAWLSPGREILIPDARFCQRDGFPCPVQAARQRRASPAPAPSISSTARKAPPPSRARTAYRSGWCTWLPGGQTAHKMDRNCCCPCPRRAHGCISRGRAKRSARWPARTIRTKKPSGGKTACGGRCCPA